jgi:lambda family phage tail tape measure protein
MASPATVLKIEAKVGGLEQVEGLKSAVRSLQNTAPPAAENINKLRDAAKSLGNAAEASTSDLRTSATVLKFLKDQVALTSKEYRDLSNDLKTVENRFNAANTAAKQFRSSAGPLSGGTAGAGIMGRPTEKLDPYMRLGFGTNDPEYWRKRQETHPGGAAIFPQQLDYAATNKALSSMQSANDQMTAVANKGRQDRLLVQEKYNQLEIAQQDAAHKKQLLNQQRMDDIEGRFFEMRLNNAASIREKAEQRIAQRRQRLVTAGQTVGAVAASGVFGGPEGALGAIIGAVGGPGGALVGGAIGAQVGMLRQAIGDTATYAAEIAKLNIALRGITKTSEEYADAQRAISLISNTLNVPIKEATAGFTKLSASVIGAGGNVNDAQIVMLGFTQAIKATSGGAKEVSGVMTALTQIFSKGKISAEEINQIAERLPGAFTAIAKAVGKTGPELQDALKNGEVGLNDLMKTAQYLTDQYGASANKMAASAEESGARMTVALDKLKLAIGETYQPIGSEFQESITNATNIAILAMESHKKNTEDLGKTISKTFGEETAKNIGDWFQRFNLSVAASVLGLQPLLNAINAINNYMGTQKTGQQKMIDAGSPNMYSDAQGNVYDAITGQLIMKAPTKFELPKSEGDDAAKKEAKLKQQIELQRELNDIESQFNAYELPRLKGLQEIQLRLAALDKDANVEAKKKLELTANELQYQIDALKISKQLNIELAKNKTIEDARLKEVQRQGIDQKMQDELKKLNLTRDTKRKAIEQGVTLELKKQTEELKKQADEYQEILRSVQQSLDQPLVVLGQNLEEEKLKLRYRRDPRALEAELQDLGIRRQFAEAQKEGLAKIKPEDRSEFLAALEVSKQKALETAEAIRALKRSIDELNAADVGQGFKNGVESFLTSIGTMSENVSQLTQNAFQGLSDGIAELVTTGKMNFNDFANSIIKDMIRIATQQLILRPILQGIGGLFGGGGGLSGGGYFDSITGLGKAGPNFGLAKGGVITQNGIQAFARGGIVDKPMLFPFAKGIGLMGEAGPEAIMPLRRGRDGNLGVAGGGGTTNVVVNVDAGGTSAQGDAPRGEQLGKALSAAVQAELIKQRRPGGLLA